MYADLTEYGAIPIEYDVLENKFHGYGSPKDKIARLVTEGRLLRLKKGLYVRNPEKERNYISTYLIANRLYGPSYVSLETILSQYSIIPERVYTTRSVTTKRSKLFETSLGRFEYFHVSKDYFSIGVVPEIYKDYSFLVAAPEKALCDKIVFTANLRIQSLKAMAQFLEEDLRVDVSDMNDIDWDIFEKVKETGVKRREISLLQEYVKNG